MSTEPVSPEPVSADLLDRVLGPEPPPFALIHRPEANGPDTLDVLVGDVSTPDGLAAIDLPGQGGGPGHDVLALIPYGQIAERGFAAPADDSPLLAMAVTEQATTPVAAVLDRLSGLRVRIRGEHFDPDDETYAATVRRVVDEEIGEGNGANFVIKRSFVADIVDYDVHSALAFFRALLERESGAYWTFIVHTGDRTFVGASPERHVSLHGGTAVMNPISGTYRYPPSGPALDGVLGFLADVKETDELYMVVDEELKMMSRICDGRVRVVGPYLKEMARLAHTEYFIEGHSTRDPRTILRETMFAPTVTGSPLESACRVISQYEPEGRGYYSGVLALIGRDEHGARTLDSSILIRTAEIDGGGRVRVGVGATLVRHSDPESEVAETRAKAAGLLAALTPSGAVRFAEHPTVRAALRERNSHIAGFWLADASLHTGAAVARGVRQVLVVDAEDTFTAMLEHQLRSLGVEVAIRRFDEPYSFGEHDFVVMGPGPGDPRRTEHPKIAHLHSAVATLLEQRRPFLAVCLSHQVLSLRLGLEVRRRDVPNQGLQREIDFFGINERVGFYNTFAAHSTQDKITCDGVGVVEASRDTTTGEVHALRGPFFASMQFHAESVLTQDGVRIIAEQMNAALGA
ncbi:anthranilate synthase family protein [Saccharopolyspora taberi]|uniref:anthranilate synthase family protein n=1 Tax=Saccharopolyspora taberi TaxID=60895 RepID=UPI0031DDE454